MHWVAIVLTAGPVHGMKDAGEILYFGQIDGDPLDKRWGVGGLLMDKGSSKSSVRWVLPVRYSVDKQFFWIIAFVCHHHHPRLRGFDSTSQKRP